MSNIVNYIRHRNCDMETAIASNNASAHARDCKAGIYSSGIIFAVERVVEIVCASVPSAK